MRGRSGRSCPRGGWSARWADDRDARALVDRRRARRHLPDGSFQPYLVRRTGHPRAPGLTGRGQATNWRAHRRGRTAVYAGRLLPPDGFARCRRGADGCGPLRRNPQQQESGCHGGGAGHAHLPPLLGRPGGAGRSAPGGCMHAELHDPGSLRRVRRAMAQPPGARLEPRPQRRIHSA